MKALVYTEPGRVTLEERPRLKPESGEVEISIELAGVCGSDISGFLGTAREENRRWCWARIGRTVERRA